MWKFSSALRQKSHLHYTTEDERLAIKTRFRDEGLDDLMPDDKKLPHVWRWLCDAEFNVISMKKQNEKLYKQQEADLKFEKLSRIRTHAMSDILNESLRGFAESKKFAKQMHRAKMTRYRQLFRLEVEEYIESLWKQSNSRLVELQNENRLLKQEIYNLKLSKPTDALDIVNNNKKNLILNNSRKLSLENGELPENTQPIDHQKETKKSAFSNVKQMFTKNKDQNANTRQSNLENELRFMIDKCRSIENEKKRLESENENLLFKLNETLAICDKLESSKTNVQMARNSKSFYELRQATSDYRLNKNEQDKMKNSRTMNFQPTNYDDNKSTSGIDSSSSQEKNDPIKLKIDEQDAEEQIKKSNSDINQHMDSGRETCSSTLTDSRDSKDFKEFTSPKELKGFTSLKELKESNETPIRIANAIREECAILKKELIAKEKQLIVQEKQLSELLLKYDKRKARHKEQMAKLKSHIDRETKRWQKLFDTAKQRTIENEQNENLVDSL